MRADDSATRTERRVRATRRKILSAARIVFSEKGFNQARIDDITERADVGKGTFYNYYETKDQLVQELVETMIRELIKNLKANGRERSDLSSLIDSIIETHIHFFSNRWEDFALFFQGRTDLTLQHGVDGIEKPYADYLACMERMILRVMRTKLPANVLSRIACAIAGFVSGYYAFAVIASNDEDVDVVFNSLKGAIVAGLVRFVNEAALLNQKETDKNEAR
ncbi:MAG: TetR/AcrR family transcriptional regulator [Verrucomicrobia bacterium]|nr:TetR/AcrR family transcriptional regulator [Verrucomicrobiota bacterium]